MQTFKKTTIAVISFVCLLALLSAAIIEPMIQFGWVYYCDGEYREKTAGEYEVLFMGDSDGMAAFNPAVYYDLTGKKAYNLSVEKNTGQYEYYMLKKEIERNPVKQVILQIGDETFTRDYAAEHADADAVAVMRMSNFFERWKYLVQNVSFDKWLDVYSRLLMRGINTWQSVIKGDKSAFFDASLLGWHRLETADCSIAQERIVGDYNSVELETEPLPERVQEFEKVIDYCKQQNVAVSVVFVPLSDAYLWKRSNMDAVIDKIKAVCDDNGVSFTDYNLYKDRYKLFTDKTTFKDTVHMSENGATVFTNLLVKIMQKQEKGEQVDKLFYSNYEQMKKDSPYMAYSNKDNLQ
ncbi:MAG: hypothetical protein IJI67_07910 [Clostridia bacterium]|nr:hypothetical protein [Clostridia bacterium]